MTTWSPGLRSVTPSPTSSMTPAPSWPRTMGATPMSVPFCTDRSEWQTPEAAMRTLTSPAWGVSRSTSWISRGWSSPVRMAAFGIARSSCDAACAHVSSPTTALCASLPVLALGRFHGVAEDDRRQQGDRPQGQGRHDQDHQRRRVLGGEADEEDDDRQRVAAVADALAETARSVDASPPGADRIVVHSLMAVTAAIPDRRAGGAVGGGGGRGRTGGGRRRGWR